MARTLIIVFLICVSSYAYYPGISQSVYKDNTRKRVFYTNIYYPAKDNVNVVNVPDIKIFEGTKFHRDAAIADGKFPVVIFVHGSGGNNESLSYIAAELASKGMIIVATNHLNDTLTETVSVSPWVQNEDIRFLLDTFIKDPKFVNHVNNKTIGILGYSKGGYSALALAGMRLDYDRYAIRCSTGTYVDCVFYKYITKNIFEKDYTDTRVTYAVALDPIFASEYVNIVELPLLVIRSEFFTHYDKIDTLTVKNLKDKIKDKSKIESIRDASHFSFLPVCTSHAMKVLPETDKIICNDGSKKRVDIHRETVRAISDFVQKQMKTGH